ncbi:MAG TPA: HDOD domain-containing protein [Burkholderiaceae bacterium]
MKTDAIRVEIDAARARGSLRQIIIPPCPELLMRLQQALAQREPDLTEVAHIAGADVAMAATLIRSSNSARHASGGKPCSTVGQAMTRLGLRETAKLMTAFLARNAVPVKARQLERFWERSTKRALALDYIAQQLPGLSPELAYTFGLFCHVGMPVLLQSLRGYGATLTEAAARIDRPFIATENANHKTDHAVAGALLVRAWGFGPELMAAVRLHHDFESLGSTDIDAEVHTLVAAGLVADQIMRRHEGLPLDEDWIAHGAAALAWLQVGGDDLLYWEEQLGPLLEEV